MGDMLPIPDRIGPAVAHLDAWLESMRQAGGYGGPVAHWWQSRYEYAGPGLDWRYEGLLIGYAELLDRTGERRWCDRLTRGADDLLAGQRPDGSLRASRFEINPGVLGTPHEAAACLGLLAAARHLPQRERILGAVNRALENLIRRLWDGAGIADHPGGRQRVPNKLATAARAMLEYDRSFGSPVFERYAVAALDDVLRYQVADGPHAGAVHQYVPHREPTDRQPADARLVRGRNHRPSTSRAPADGRFFPYYNARCVPPLAYAAEILDAPRYLEAARRILSFLDATAREDGSWPQIVYANGRTSEWPRWYAGVADILLAYHVLGSDPPAAALDRLLDSQQPSGGFPTAQGFKSQIRQRDPRGDPDYRDVQPVVGWNDKVLRLLTLLQGPDSRVPDDADVCEVRIDVDVWGTPAIYRETFDHVTIRGQQGMFYAWNKLEVWAQLDRSRMGVR